MKGVKTLYEGSDRYKYDALEFYQSDIDWFAFILISFSLDIFICYLEFSDKIESFYSSDV